MIKKLFTALYADGNLLYFDEGSGDAIFSYNGILIILILIILLRKKILILFFLSDFLAWYINFEKRKKLKKELSKELILTLWHPNKWWDWCMSEDEKKRNKSNVYWRVVKMCVGSMQYVGIETFYLLSYLNILIQTLNYIKSLCIVFMLN